MARKFLLLAITGLTIGSSGCFLNIYSSDPNTRMHELMNTSEDLRQIEDEWARFWFVDQPSHMTPDRTHGGVAP